MVVFLCETPWKIWIFRWIGGYLSTWIESDPQSRVALTALSWPIQFGRPEAQQFPWKGTACCGTGLPAALEDAILQRNWMELDESSSFSLGSLFVASKVGFCLASEACQPSGGAEAKRGAKSGCAGHPHNFLVMIYPIRIMWSCHFGYHFWTHVGHWATSWGRGWDAMEMPSPSCV